MAITSHQTPNPQSSSARTSKGSSREQSWEQAGRYGQGIRPGANEDRSMRKRTYRTRAVAPDQHALALRERGVRKILESGLPSDHPLMATAIAFVKGMPSPATTQICGYNIGHWFGWCVANGVEPVTATHLNGRAYLGDLYGSASGSRAQRLSSLRSFYDLLVNEEIVARNPFRRIVPLAGEPITPTPALTFDEFRRLLSLIRQDFGHPDRDICVRIPTSR